MKKLSLFTLLLTLCLGWLHAQTYNVTVSGQVTDINGGAPIPNHLVDVSVDSSFFGFSYSNSVLTDANGNYSDVIAVPGSVTQGTGQVGTRDCTPAGYHSLSFSFSGAATIPNLDFQVCTSGGSGCSALFSANHIQGTTIVNFTDLSSSSGTITGWAWDFGDGGSSNQQNPQHAYNSMGPYVVCLTITDNTGCTDTRCDTVSLGVFGTNCSVSLTASASPSGVVAFTASATGTGSPLLYTFDFGDGSTPVSSASSSVTYTYATSGTYLACVTVDFSDSCRATDCATVNIQNSNGCQAGFTWYPDTTGQFSIIVVNTATGNNLSYQWSFGDGTGSTQAYPMHQYAGPGTYVVCLTVTSLNPSCTSTYCDSLVVVNKVNTPFTINVVASGASATDPGQGQPFSAQIAPNPANGFFQLQLSLPQADEAQVELMDLSGKTVARQSIGRLDGGAHELRMSTEQLPAGLYIARVQVGERSLTQKLVVAH